MGRLTLVAVPPTSRSADCTRGRLRLKLTPTLATMACPWPTTPATPVGPESEHSGSPPPALAAAARGARSLMGFLSLQLTTMLPCLPFLHHLVPTATGEVTESGDGYEVKQTHGLHASSFQSVTRGAAEPAAEEEA